MNDIDQIVERMESAAKDLAHKEWYVLRQPWVSYTDTFTILGGSPDPHVGVPILETVADEEKSEDDDHSEQEVRAAWLEMSNPQNVLTLIAEWRAQKAEIEKLREALEPSGATKVAYIGEFWWATEEFTRVEVPWTVIKDIMKSITARARKALETSNGR